MPNLVPPVLTHYQFQSSLLNNPWRSGKAGPSRAFSRQALVDSTLIRYRDSALILLAKSMQLHLLQPAVGSAKGKGQIALGIELIHRHPGFDIQGHLAVIALVHQGDKTPHAVIVDG